MYYSLQTSSVKDKRSTLPSVEKKVANDTTLLEKFWQISLHVTDDAIAKQRYVT